MGKQILVKQRTTQKNKMNFTFSVNAYQESQGGKKHDLNKNVLYFYKFKLCYYIKCNVLKTKNFDKFVI